MLPSTASLQFLPLLSTLFSNSICVSFVNFALVHSIRKVQEKQEGVELNELNQVIQIHTAEVYLLAGEYKCQE